MEERDCENWGLKGKINKIKRIVGGRFQILTFYIEANIKPFSNKYLNIFL